MNDGESVSVPSSLRGAGAGVVLVSAAFFALAGLLWADLWPFRSPVAPATKVPAWVIDPAPVRHPKLRPEIELAGFTYRCSDCHDLFASPPETTRSLTQHRDIVLKHGINARCFNCHHLTHRDAFVDDWGREIPYDKPQLLCAKCHGPVYRDWTHGSHGRTNGYWDPRRGPLERRKCIECHDPHQPPFPPMPPAPPPNTLRMGNQSFPDEHGARTNPLRVYRQMDSHDGPTTRSDERIGSQVEEEMPWTSPEARQTTRPKAKVSLPPRG
ncbi:MAG: hypothetical protein JXQ73_18480 [Phycisphaerae bacterium]|nr:hypothetical protein [Phycisphaerae bacterium]